MKKLLLVLLVSSTPLLASACGQNKQSEQEKAEVQAEAYVKSQQAGDWAQFCGLLTTKSQETIQQTIVQEDGAKPASCIDAIQGSSTKTQIALRKAASVITVSGVEVNGDQAIITAKTPKGNKSLGMVKEDDQWRVALVP